MNWIYLAIAIISEVIATSVLKATSGFSRFWPSTIVIIGYISAFYFLSLTLRSIPVGIAYAIWCGVGLILISLASWFFYGQKLDNPALLGMFLIVAGILVINLFSKVTTR